MDVIKYRVALGKSIQTTRKNRFMLQVDLAFDAELNQNYVSNIENAKVNYSIRILIRVANASEVKPSTLFILAVNTLTKKGGDTNATYT